MQLAHPLKDGLTRVNVCFDAKRRVFSNHLTNGYPHLLRTAFIPRLDSN